MLHLLVYISYFTKLPSHTIFPRLHFVVVWLCIFMYACVCVSILLPSLHTFLLNDSMILSACVIWKPIASKHPIKFHRQACIYMYMGVCVIGGILAAKLGITATPTNIPISCAQRSPHTAHCNRSATEWKDKLLLCCSFLGS